VSESKIKKPEVVVFAGPNGSGKSTITELLRPAGFQYINADIIQSQLGCDNYVAARNAEARREDCIKRKENFCFETVLSTNRNIDLLQRAKQAGYFVRCYYVLTADPLINIARVQSRVAAGGHDVPVEKIVERYDRSLSLIRSLIPICDICHIYDNTQKSPYRIFKKRKSKFLYCPLQSLWAKADIIQLTGVSEIERSALN
jgi:predicted ABC-type ATPase